MSADEYIKFMYEQNPDVPIEVWIKPALEALEKVYNESKDKLQAKADALDKLKELVDKTVMVHIDYINGTYFIETTASFRENKVNIDSPTLIDAINSAHNSIIP